MVTKNPLSSLCLLSLAIPILGHSNIWLFSGAAQTPPLATTESATLVAAQGTAQPESARPSKRAHKEEKIWECDVLLGIGYRHDKLSQRYTPRKGSGAHREKFKDRDVDSVMGTAKIDGRLFNMLFSIEGDYSPVVSGTLSAPFNADTSIDDTFNFKFKKISGYEADALAEIGYRLPFMHGYHANAALTLQVGYRYSHQSYETEKQDSITEGTTISYLQDQAPAHTEWFGPFVEVRLDLSYINRFYIQPFYQYYFLDYRSERNEAQKVFSYASGSPPVPFEFLVKFWTEGNEARGQAGGFDLYYEPAGKRFRVGLKGTYLAFASRETKTTVKQKEIFLNTNPTTSIRTEPKYNSHANWESYSVAVYGGYVF